MSTLLSVHANPIQGTLERISGTAKATTGSRSSDGMIEVDYDGYTEVYWDEQRTVEKHGVRQFVDEDGTIVPETAVRVCLDESEIEVGQRVQLAWTEAFSGISLKEGTAGSVVGTGDERVFVRLDERHAGLDDANTICVGPIESGVCGVVYPLERAAISP
jgi:hypothetical protein